MVENIFIVDWDDTLFPTNFLVNEKKIKSLDTMSSNKEIMDLDINIYNLLKQMDEYGSIYIVTNANYPWVVQCLSILPVTNKFIIKNSINIISARNEYESMFKDISMWKKRTFEKILDKHIEDNKILNIMSYGDNIYEYNALVDLYTYLENKKSVFLLKNITFIIKPSMTILIEELNNCCTQMYNIIHIINNMDIKFIE
jgi:hypothetical protein